MTESRKKVLVTSGYISFALFMTLFFVYLTFPLEVLEDRVMQAIAKSGPLPFKLSFAKASPYRLTGLELEDVTLTMNETAALRQSADGGKTEAAPSVHLDRMRARLQIFPLLFKKTYAVTFDVDANDGHVSGEFRLGKHETGLTLVANDIDLAHPPILKKFFGVEALGSVDANVAMTLAEDIKKSTGGGTIQLKKGATGEVAIMGFTVPPVDIGTLHSEFEIHDGALTFKDFSQKGSDLEAKVTGDIQLRQPPPLSNVNMGLKFKLTEGFLQKNPKFKTIVQISGLERTRSADGFYSAKLTGTLANPIPSM